MVVATKHQVSSNLGEDLAILSLRAGTYYTLNRVGARVWSLVQEPVSVAVLRDTLLAEFEVARERLEADLTGLLEALSHEGLIELSDGPLADARPH